MAAPDSVSRMDFAPGVPIHRQNRGAFLRRRSVAAMQVSPVPAGLGSRAAHLPRLRAPPKRSLPVSPVFFALNGQPPAAEAVTPPSSSPSTTSSGQPQSGPGTLRQLHLSLDGSDRSARPASLATPSIAAFTALTDGSIACVKRVLSSAVLPVPVCAAGGLRRRSRVSITALLALDDAPPWTLTRLEVERRTRPVPPAQLERPGSTSDVGPGACFPAEFDCRRRAASLSPQPAGKFWAPPVSPIQCATARASRRELVRRPARRVSQHGATRSRTKVQQRRRAYSADAPSSAAPAGSCS